ncbi:hypothetical protein OSB04_010088 [Centaurea solstitialis]|uniref:BHLH domain-containing protein n=1 Tax=Centaurea solstitialis TaxID=347529 RepID=A0AA38T8J4_9ASTR|nr:hypothetical protein OSB04_010088 [Centaurea solstitialis]
MEKEKIFTNEGNGIIPQPWNPIFGMGIPPSVCLELNCLISANSNTGIPIPIPIPTGDSIVLRELIGRLGSICNSGEISPINGNNSTTNSCYNTPLNSPPKLNLSIPESPIPGNHQFQPSPFPTDPGFVERAARFSSFGLKEAEFPQSAKLSRVSSSQSFKTIGSQFLGIPDDNKDQIPIPIPIPIPSNSDKKLSRLAIQENTEFGGDSREESSVSEQIPGGERETETGMKSQSTNGRKRKAIPKGKGKETPTTPSSTTIYAKDDKGLAEPEKGESDAKRSKSDEQEKGMEGNQKQTKGIQKALEPPKDYIHVRAKRGQATDSHSLAERVRREKISERMKFLQDLVPGCNKVTGKAVMLDEIINYVQALQRQVEFLSMKLATVNPRMDATMEALLSKDLFRSRVSVPTSMNPFDSSTQPFPYGFQSQNNGMVLDGSDNQFSVNPLMAAMHRNSIMKPSHVDGFGEASTFWENDLQSVVKMALGQDEPQGFHGQMKVEL